MSNNIVEVRCPIGSNSLLLKMRAAPDTARGVSVSNTLLVMCRPCTQKERRVTGRDDFRVIHEFDIEGTYIDSFHENL